MAEINAIIERNSSTDGHFGKESLKISQRENSRFVDSELNPELYRRPDYFVYIYTVGDRSMVRELSPHIPHLTIPACPKGQKYLKVTKLPHPFNQSAINGEGQQVMYPLPALRVAMDIVNPSNTSLNQDAKIQDKWSEGNNYGRLGVFFSKNDPPTDEEVNAAIHRKEEHYRYLLNQANLWAVSDPRLVAEGIRDDHRLAAEYFDEDVTWHKVAKRPHECENCGEKMKQGAKFHMGSWGTICISPTVEGWQAAVRAGAKKANEVPEEFREPLVPKKPGPAPKAKLPELEDEL